MTEMLDAAVAKLAALPAQQQDRIAQWLLQELPMKISGTLVSLRVKIP